jgi:hypothetical protein
MRTHFLTTAAALACALALPTSSNASELFAATYSAPSSDLYMINQSTGAATLIGAIGQNIGDLTSTNSSILGIDLTNNALWTINPTTAVASGEVSITGTAGEITSIAWDPVTHVLFGNTTAGFGGDDQLYKINQMTGAATLVGDLNSENIYALGFSQTGVLLGESNASGELVSINTSTGAATDIGLAGIYDNYDLASRPGDNVVFGLDSGTYSLYTYNLTTGAATAVGPYGVDVNLAGLAFLPAGAAAAPEPATWAMMIAGFAAIGFAACRNTRKTAVSIV